LKDFPSRPCNAWAAGRENKRKEQINVRNASFIGG
jgi:hypothetical protein